MTSFDDFWEYVITGKVHGKRLVNGKVTREDIVEEGKKRGFAEDSAEVQAQLNFFGFRKKINYLELVKVGDEKMNLFHPSFKVKFAYKTRIAANNRAKKLHEDGFNVVVLHTEVGWQIVGVKRHD